LCRCTLISIHWTKKKEREEVMPDPNVKRILWYLFVGSRGGINRVKIIDLLKEHPYIHIAELAGLSVLLRITLL
jgi:hypothetical protein